MGRWYCLSPCQCGDSEGPVITHRYKNGSPEAYARVECRACGVATAWGYAETVEAWDDMVGRVADAWNDGEFTAQDPIESMEVGK